MKKIGIGILAVVVLLVVVIVLGRSGGKKAEATTNETVKRGNLLSQVTETGSLDAVKTVEVKSKVSGRISKLHV